MIANTLTIRRMALTRKHLAIAMLCCWFMSASAADPWCSSRGKPSFYFEWLPKDEAEPSLGSVRIKNASGAVVQVLENVENYRGDTESLDTGRDFNNDGCRDLVVTSSKGAAGDEGVTAFLYNSNTRRFELSESLSQISNLDLDPRDKNCVTESGKAPPDHVYDARYCWNNGELVKKSEHYSVGVYNKKDELLCYRHERTDYYRGGKKRRRISCTKES
jgi:hypothetical protein